MKMILRRPRSYRKQLVVYEGNKFLGAFITIQSLLKAYPEARFKKQTRRIGDIQSLKQGEESMMTRKRLIYVVQGQQVYRRPVADNYKARREKYEYSASAEAKRHIIREYQTQVKELRFKKNLAIDIAPAEQKKLQLQIRKLNKEIRKLWTTRITKLKIKQA